jgi:hypothetical protein
MPFIGNQPALSFTSFAKQDFTTSATTSYTLDNSVANANELALFINFVRQEPTAAYTASGTSLTLTSATSSSDDMYCVYLGKAVQTVNPPNASVGTAQLADSSVTSAKLGSGATNTPAFHVYGASETLSAQTYTKLGFESAYYNIGSSYDTTADRFTVPSGEAGKYFFHATYRIENDSGHLISVFYKNGSRFDQSMTENGYGTARYISCNLSTTFDLSVGDYLEFYAYIDVGNSNAIIAKNLIGYKIIE